MSEAAGIFSSDDAFPAAPESSAAQQQELSIVQNFDWFSKSLLPMFAQVATIAAVVVAGMFGKDVGLEGWPAVLSASAGLMAFELGRAHLRNKADMNRELALYHSDIAHALGKSPSEKLTIADMRRAADESALGDKALKPLKMELDHLRYRGKYNLVMGAARAMVTGFGAYFMSGALSQAKDMLGHNWMTMGSSLFYPLSGALAGIGVGTVSIENLGKSYFNKHKPPSAWADLTRLEKEAKHRALEPEEVFSALVKIDKPLAHEIESHLGEPYEELVHRNKLRVMKACEARTQAAALTQAINEGASPVTAIALQAFHQWENPCPPPAPRREEEKGAVAFAPQPRRENCPDGTCSAATLVSNRSPAVQVAAR